MNPINTIFHQQASQVSKNTALRNVPGSGELPKLTKDEEQFIQEKFQPSKAMNMYSMDGKMNTAEFSRGRNLDTRI